MGPARELATKLFHAAIDRADPYAAVKGQLARENRDVVGRNIVIAIGKAAIPMMRAALETVPEPRTALVVTNPENICDIPGVTVLAGAHPVPDESSQAAGRAIVDLLSKAGPDDHVTALISGGGSALAVAPVTGVSLQNKADINAALLAGGIEINEMNLVRQQLSDLKGGGFLRHASPAKVTAYLLSDVIGDDMRAIASGPTVAPIGTRADAVKTLKDHGIWDQVPVSVQKHLSKPNTPTTHLAATNTIVGSNRLSLEAMLAAVPEDWNATIATDTLVGDVGDAAEFVLNAGHTAPPGPQVLIFGGETTVKLGGTGRGGRNQELALRVALGADGRLRDGWTFLSGGTDGRDGPTDAAGGLVDANTMGRMQTNGADPQALLQNNDSYAALSASGDLLVIGGTGTNVADVQVLILP
ncbi:MOFRL domain-containing protein [Actibacterium mucosum KCTC 23349]|uniref:MOFRL domain-containing protein n=2 Tax=Actibacterium TaxID=1433986 RepID=A0A037ZJ92_9RHOB|nr:MOFRL domain-containing protein [Actibacterium mucosum KCTC 23349]